MSTLQVDRIIPYQSSSVVVEGLSAPNLATTGSNTFVGDQNIQGTITASIQEGFALVGGVGDVSTLVATSSLTGDSFPYTGDAVITGSLTISGSDTADLNVVGRQSITGPTTGQTPQLIISSSDFTNTIGRGSITISGSGAFTPGFLVNSPSSSGNLSAVGMTVSRTGAGGVGGAIDFGNYLAVSTGDASELSLAADASQYSFPANWNKGPAICANDPTDTYPAIIGFQNKTNWTDGRPTFLTPVDFTNNVDITGSLTISGSSEFDLTIQGRGLITGPTTGQTPQLLISSSDFTNRIGRSTSYILPAGRTFGSGIGNGRLDAAADLNQIAILNVGVFDEPNFVTDIELLVQVATGSGIQFQDVRNDNYAYTTWMQIAPNTGNNPPVQFKREIEITGSVNITDVIQLAGLDPLPAGGVGQLAVSSSGDLYYHNGAGWQLK